MFFLFFFFLLWEFDMLFSRRGSDSGAFFGNFESFLAVSSDESSVEGRMKKKRTRGHDAAHYLSLQS